MKSLLLLFILVSVLYPAKFYIDFATGSDANNGTAKATPWKKCSGMNLASGNASSHTFATGDTFIFKGGVTWDSSCFQMVVDDDHAYSGSGYTYTVDSTWYTGESFTRPVLDIMEKPLDPVIKCWYKNDVKFDNFEIKNMKGSSGATFGIYDNNRSVFTDLYMHSPHFSVIDGSSNHKFMVFNACSTITVERCVLICQDSGYGGIGSSGVGYAYTLRYNTIQGGNGAILLASGCNNSEVSYNDMSNIFQSNFPPTDHTNAFFVYGLGSGYIHHNRVHNVNTMCFWENRGNWKVYNNIVYDVNGSQAANWENETACPTCSLEFVNNYIEGSYIVTGRAKRAGYLSLKNNIFNGIQINDTITNKYIDYNLYIQDSTTTTKYLEIFTTDYNVAAARAAGYDTHSVWALIPGLADTGYPTSALSAVIGKGKNFNVAPFNTWPDFMIDFAGNARPEAEAWDIGAWQYQTGSVFNHTAEAYIKRSKR